MSRFNKNIQVSTEWMIYPNPYFFFRPPKKSDLLAIACWMSAAGRPREEEEWRVLRQLRRYYGYPTRTRGPDPGNSSKADPGQASVWNSWIAVVAGVPALEAWGYSIPWLFSQQSLSRLRMPLPDTRVAEIRALRRLGCRRDKIPSFPRCRQGVNRLAWIQITNLYGKS